MDYFEGVVTDYLSADRAMFVNPQCRIQLNAGDTPNKGEHWYCDILASSKVKVIIPSGNTKGSGDGEAVISFKLYSSTVKNPMLSIR